MFEEPESVTPRRGIAFALTVLSTIMHLGSGVFLAFIGAVAGVGSVRLLGALQFVFGLVAAVCAYRIWERDISGPWIAVPLGVAAAVLTLVAGIDLPILLKAALLLPAALEIVGAVAVLRVPEPV